LSFRGAKRREILLFHHHSERFLPTVEMTEGDGRSDREGRKDEGMPQGRRGTEGRGDASRTEGEAKGLGDASRTVGDGKTGGCLKDGGAGKTTEKTHRNEAIDHGFVKIRGTARTFFRMGEHGVEDSFHAGCIVRSCPASFPVIQNIIGPETRRIHLTLLLLPLPLRLVPGANHSRLMVVCTLL